MKTTKDTKRGTAKRPAAKKTKTTARTVAKSVKEEFLLWPREVFFTYGDEYRHSTEYERAALQYITAINPAVLHEQNIDPLGLWFVIGEIQKCENVRRAFFDFRKKCELFFRDGESNFSNVRGELYDLKKATLSFLEGYHDMAKSEEVREEGGDFELSAWQRRRLANWIDNFNEAAEAFKKALFVQPVVAPSPSAASAPVAGSAAKPCKRGRPKNPNGRSDYTPSPDRLAVFIAIMEEYRRDPGAKWAEAVATCEKRDGKRYDWYAVDKNATRWANYNGTDRTSLRALSAADWEKRKAELK